MNTIGIFCRRVPTPAEDLDQTFRASRHRGSDTSSRRRNPMRGTASADENAWAANPNCRTISGSDSRTDSSSSTIDTSERVTITRSSMSACSPCPHGTRVCRTSRYRIRQVRWNRPLDLGVSTTPTPVRQEHLQCGASLLWLPPREFFRARAQPRTPHTSRTSGVSDRWARTCHGVALFLEIALSVSRHRG